MISYSMDYHSAVCLMLVTHHIGICIVLVAFVCGQVYVEWRLDSKAQVAKVPVPPADVEIVQTPPVEEVRVNERPRPHLNGGKPKLTLIHGGKEEKGIKR